MTDPKDSEPDLSFLNYENSISTESDLEEIHAIYYPPTKQSEDGLISIGYASGNDLARNLDLVSWQEWKAPGEGLASPASIEFCIQDDYRITIYQKPRQAVVNFQGKVRYYKTHGGDYEDAVDLFYKESRSESHAKQPDLNSESNADQNKPADARPSYTYNVAYANWTDDGSIYAAALNTEKMLISSALHLPVYKFDTEDDLLSFKTTFRDILTMDRGLDETPSFDYITSAYDDSFFSKYSLLPAYVTANSGSYRYGVSDVFCDDQSFCMYVEQLNAPESYDSSMSGWFVVVEAGKEDIAGCVDFDAQMKTL